MGMQEKFIGLNGALYVLLNQLVAWGFGTFRSSIRIYWLNRFGVFFITKIHFSLVFSAKYFPNCNILDAPIHPKCSYAWRSILTARGVIEKGAI